MKKIVEKDVFWFGKQGKAAKRIEKSVGVNNFKLNPLKFRFMGRSAEILLKKNVWKDEKKFEKLI